MRERQSSLAANAKLIPSESAIHFRPIGENEEDGKMAKHRSNASQLERQLPRHMP